MNKMDGMSMDLTGENVEQLKKLFPEAVTEGKIDFEVLKALLGGEVEKRQEYYKFTWNGKEAARAYARTRSMGTLRPCEAESSGRDGTPGKFDSENLYIEGDNLEVLKLLQGPYHKKVKMIYIDPPYNTGKDFVYPDNFRDSIGNYKALTGQTDAEGRSTRANPETSGRYHTDWLNMMYPRLILARNLLTDDGVIFISIDDTEVANLRKICDDVFGEESFVDIFNWAKTETPENLSKKSKQIIEYVLCYQKNKNDQKFKGIKKTSQSSNGLLNQPNAIGILTFPANVVQTSIPNGKIKRGMYGTEAYDVELLEDTEVKDGIFVQPVKLKARFKWQQSYLDKELANGTVIKIPTIKFSPSYEKIEYDAEVPANLVNSKVNVGTNENAGTYQEELFGKKVFNYPKPTSLIKYLIGFNETEEDGIIILDFFSGSGTTADAILQMNTTSNYNKRFILVQIPENLQDVLAMAKTPAEKTIVKNAIEICNQQGKRENLCSIAQERIRRAAKKIREENPLVCQNQDMGFKVFKLDTSNLLPWNPDAETLAQDLYNAVDNVLADRTTDDLLYEILLKCNLPLTLPIEKKQFGENTVYIVGMGALAICLDKTIPATIAEEIVKLRGEYAPIVPMQVVFRDNGFDDVGKTNALQILKQAGFEEKSIQTI